VTIFGLTFVLFVIIPLAVRLFVIRPILADVEATPIRVGFWGGLLAWPRSLAQTHSFLGLTVPFPLFLGYLMAVWYGTLMSNDRDFSFLVFLFLNLVFIVSTVLFAVALFLKLRARRSPE
jgi:hypothetical protein